MFNKNNKHLLILLIIHNIFGNINSRLIPEEYNIKINNQDDGNNDLEFAKNTNDIDGIDNSITINKNNLNLNQPFKGYYPSSNIGVIPPKHVDAGEYYNLVANLENKTFIINEHPDDDSKNYDQKSIKNLLEALSKLHIMINTHDHKYQLINITKVDHKIEEISILPDNLRSCGPKELKTCGDDNTPFCTEDKVFYCVKNFNQDEECGNNNCDNLIDCTANLVIDKSSLREFTMHVKEGRKLNMVERGGQEDKGLLCVTKKGKLNVNAVETNVKKFCSNCDYNKNKQVNNIKF